MTEIDDLWQAFQRASEFYQAEPSDENCAALIAAHGAWVKLYVPETWESLVAEFRDTLRRRKGAA